MYNLKKLNREKFRKNLKVFHLPYSYVDIIYYCLHNSTWIHCIFKSWRNIEAANFENQLNIRLSYFYLQNNNNNNKTEKWYDISSNEMSMLTFTIKQDSFYIKSKTVGRNSKTDIFWHEIF